MKLLNPLLKVYLAARIPRIRHTMAHPHVHQQAIFQQLLKAGKHTLFGAEKNLQQVNSYDEFTQAVPIHAYEALCPYVERIKNGEPNVLWNEPVKWMAKSSGTTTGRSKFIPLSKSAIKYNHVKGGKDLMAWHYQRHPQSRVFAGKSLILGGALDTTFHNGKIKAGDVSAVLIQQIPEWLQFFREPARSIATMQNWEHKVEAIAQRIVKEDITTISGVPTWLLVVLQRVLQLSGKETIGEVWPHLELFVHGGIDFSPYKKQYEMLIGKPISYINAYNASEGFFAFQDSDEEGMWLHTGCGIFYEFIPLEEYHNNTSKAIPLAETEVGKSYVMVITTNGGLWRYTCGDVVMFTSTQPYRLLITGRTAHYINAFGEEVMAHNTDLALANTCKEFNCTVKEYTVAPIFYPTGRGAHQWLIEFENNIPPIQQFTLQLDKHLRQLNSDYDAKRFNDMILQTPVITVATPGTFYTWLKENHKLGGQHKVPRLSNTRVLIEQLLMLCV